VKEEAVVVVEKEEATQSQPGRGGDGALAGARVPVAGRATGDRRARRSADGGGTTKDGVGLIETMYVVTVV
jgi:hypothetical protein